MRTVIINKDGTVLWTSPEFEAGVTRNVTPPVDDPALSGQPGWKIGTGTTVEAAIDDAKQADWITNLYDPGGK